VRTRVTTLSTSAPNPRWILDFTAASHIDWNKRLFISLRQSLELLDMAGDLVEAGGMGTVKLDLRGKNPIKAHGNRYSVFTHSHGTYCNAMG